MVVQEEEVHQDLKPTQLRPSILLVVHQPMHLVVVVAPGILGARFQVDLLHHLVDILEVMVDLQHLEMVAVVVEAVVPVVPVVLEPQLTPSQDGQVQVE
jgi:hypothetical protein